MNESPTLRLGHVVHNDVKDSVDSFGLTIERTQLLIAIRREPLNLTRFGAIARNAQCA